MTTSQDQLNSTGLSRDIRLVELLASDHSLAHGGYGVSELARRTGRSKSVVSRALATLAAANLVSRDPDTQAYSVGSRLFAIAARSSEARLAQLARPVLAGLVRSTQETAHLCVLSHGNELTLASELSPHDLRSAGWQGVTTAAWRTSSGRVLISDWDDETLRAWYDAHGSDHTVIDADLFDREDNPFRLVDTPRTRVHDFDTLMAEIVKIRQQGFALLDEEFEVGVIGVSAPVYDHTRRLVAAVNASGPKSRLGDRLDALSSVVRQAAFALSKSLGAPPAKQ